MIAMVSRGLGYLLYTRIVALRSMDIWAIIVIQGYWIELRRMLPPGDLSSNFESIVRLVTGLIPFTIPNLIPPFPANESNF